jgi:hypothetical protein
MGWLDRWDVVLLLIAAYVAVMSLVRMMTRRRDQVVADVERQLKAQREKGKNESAGRRRGRDAA